MIEKEWLVCTDPQAMLTFLGGKASDRKLRLFAVACCRPIFHLLSKECRTVVMIAECWADGNASKREVAGVRLYAPYWAKDAVRVAALATANRSAKTAALTASQFAVKAARYDKNQTVRLRCIFGNPFRPLPLDPTWIAWNDGTVSKIAQAIYDERAFDRMPILADALEDAGCTDRAILNHCRQPGEHVRGCWLVDLLLGKECHRDGGRVAGLHRPDTDAGVFEGQGQ